MNETLQTEREPRESPEMLPTRPPKVLKVKLKYIVLLIAVVLVAAGIYYFRGLFVAAVVNGSPISRWSVVQESEKQVGKKTLDYLITKKLIEDETSAKQVTVTSQEVTDEIKKIEASVVQQGGTLASLLQTQGITQAELTSQITLEKKLEGLLTDAVTVSDADVDAYIKANAVTFPKGSDETAEKAKIKDQLRQGKMSQAAQSLITRLKSQARISYFVTY